jgi:Mg-chelatase subunit ChlD
MTVYDSRLSEPMQVNRRHITDGVLAFVLSFAIHAVLLFYLSGMRFDVVAVSPEILQNEHMRAMKLGNVEPAPLDISRPDVLAPGDSAFVSDPDRDVAELSEPPDRAVIEPPPLIEELFAGATEAMVLPSPAPDRERWEPRQEILAIEQGAVVRDLRGMKRRIIPKIERVPQAADIVEAVHDTGTIVAMTQGGGARTPTGHKTVTQKPGKAEIVPDPVTKPQEKEEEPELVIAEPESISGLELFEEERTAITPHKAIERLLKASLITFSDAKERDYAYFMVQIERAGKEELPVIPKDVVLVQDCSASMAERRLYFCREGLTNCLSMIGPKDRFNIIRFSDRSELCFEDWAAPSPQALRQARTYMTHMRSAGETDIFTSIRTLLDLRRESGRPLIALLVTDGRSTTGVTESSNIIGDFTKLNDGGVSVMTMGTVTTANRYLLDLLSYCNRGISFVETKGRWEIPTSMPELMRAVSRPVLSEVRFLFAEGSGCEVYPELTSNLYLDRPLVLYGRFPRNTQSSVFQAVGRASGITCDMIFDLPLARATKTKDKRLRTIWARQKIYHLIGQYARTPRPEVMREIIRTSKDYDIDVPYRGRF